MPYKDKEKRREAEKKYEQSDLARKTRKAYKSSEKGLEVRKKVYKNGYKKLKEKGYYTFGPGALARLKSTCEKRGHLFTLTEEELKNWWNSLPNICHYCGTDVEEFNRLKEFVLGYKGGNLHIEKFKTIFKTNTHAKITSLTIDRRDNSTTYFTENMVKACWFCNCIKSNILTEQQMLSVARSIMDELKSSVRQARDEWVGPSIKRVEKGWGWEDWIWNSHLYCGKILFFKAGKRCSYHYHKIKDETFYLQSGKLLVRYGLDDDISSAKEVTLSPGDSFSVPIGLRHQMMGLEDSELFEFSSTHYEDDSYRIIKGD